MQLSTLLGDYPVTSALKSGEVSSTAISFRFADVKARCGGIDPETGQYTTTTPGATSRTTRRLAPTTAGRSSKAMCGASIRAGSL